MTASICQLNSSVFLRYFHQLAKMTIISKTMQRTAAYPTASTGSLYKKKITAKMSINIRYRKKPSRWRLKYPLIHHIANSFPGFYHFLNTHFLQFLPQPGHIHSQRIIINKTIRFPESFHELISSDNLAFLLQQSL